MSERYSQFPGVVCQKLRNLADEAEVSEANHDKAIQDRDEALARSREPGISPEDKEAHDAEYGRQVQRIETLRKRANWCKAEMVSTVNSARRTERDTQATLPFQDADLHMPDFSPKAPKPKEPRKDETPQEPKPDPEQMALAEGQDEHLKASIGELNLADETAKALRNAGYENVGQIALAMDKSEDLNGLTGVQQADAFKAVGRFRSQHRDAMNRAEREAAGV